MYKISIIIPVYNACEYLEDCINSLKCQTIGFDNLEVIIADDGSTDDSRDLMRQYAEQYSNIKCIYLDKNSGAAGKPRNEAMREATAEYLMFLDSDDKYYDNACQILFEAMRNIETDCASGFYSTFEKDIVLEENALSGSKIEEKLYLVPDDIEVISDFQSHFACKIYKRNIIENSGVRFPEGIIGEDVVFFWRYLCNVKSIYYKEIPILKYRQRRENNKSVSYNLSQKYFEDTLKGLELMKQYLSKKGYYDGIMFALKNTNKYFIGQLINSDLSRECVYIFLNSWSEMKGGYSGYDNSDPYIRIIMDDINIGNLKGASNKVILLRELKRYYNEVWDAKTFYECQYENVKAESEKLRNWCDELQQSKAWIEGQYNNIKEENEKLRNWCNELQQGKAWIEGQYDNIKEEKVKLQNWCEEQQEGKAWLEEQYNNVKTEYDKLQSWCEEQQRRKGLFGKCSGINKADSKHRRGGYDKSVCNWIANAGYKFSIMGVYICSIINELYYRIFIRYVFLCPV